MFITDRFFSCRIASKASAEYWNAEEYWHSPILRKSDCKFRNSITLVLLPNKSLMLNHFSLT